MPCNLQNVNSFLLLKSRKSASNTLKKFIFPQFFFIFFRLVKKNFY